MSLRGNQQLVVCPLRLLISMCSRAHSSTGKEGAWQRGASQSRASGVPDQRSTAGMDMIFWYWMVRLAPVARPLRLPDSLIWWFSRRGRVWMTSSRRFSPSTNSDIPGEASLCAVPGTDRGRGAGLPKLSRASRMRDSGGVSSGEACLPCSAEQGTLRHGDSLSVIAGAWGDARSGYCEQDQLKNLSCRT
jgi:hypothetical protein